MRILTLGLGAFSTVSFLPTLGLGTGVANPINPLIASAGRLMNRR